MIVVTVNFTAVQVAKYARGEPLLLKIFFHDGSQERFVEKHTELANVEEMIQHLINDVRKMEKELHAKKGGGFLDDVVMVRFGDDEEKVEERLFHVLSRVKEEAKKLRTPGAAQNYLQKIATFQGAKFTF
jgi:hypothetical protein